MQGSGPSEELQEVEEELVSKKGDAEAGDAAESAAAAAAAAKQSAMLWQAFTLTFLAEWGDRSQIATIALAAAKNPVGVTLGGILGHAMCTGLAVIGGRMLAARISEKMVAYFGGTLFLLFAVVSFFVPDF